MRNATAKGDENAQSADKWLRSLVGKKHREFRAPAEARGFYVLCDGSAPVYIGQTNNLRKRMREHHADGRKRRFWDHLSWFTIGERDYLDDIEALMVAMLPAHLRVLNRECPKFTNRIARLLRRSETDQVVNPPREFPKLLPK